jgi:integrase
VKRSRIIASKMRKKSSSRSGSDDWPREIRSGSAVVTVYRQERPVGDLFTVVHYLDGKRERKGYSDQQEALAEAEKIASRIAKIERQVFHVSDSDWRLYTMATEALRPSGVAIDVACREFAEARRILGPLSIMDAAKSFVKQQTEGLVAKNVPEIVEELIEAKKNAGVGTRGINDYKSRLRRFATAFHSPIASITKDEVQQFLDSLKVAARTKRNFKANIVTLFDYARSKKYLSRDRKTEAEHLDSIEGQGAEIGIFSPPAFAKLLSNAEPNLIPYLAIRAFAGIRDSEINRMEWRHIKWDEGLIEVPAAIAKKTRAKHQILRRLVPIQPNLMEWLKPSRESVGKICAFYNSERVARHLAEKLEIPWVHNGLRHGYGSYQVAATRNYPQVAYEMGNSVEIIKASYDQVVTPRPKISVFESRTSRRSTSGLFARKSCRTSMKT